MAQKLLTDETGQLILQAIKELDTVALNKIGDLTGLNTSNKASLVAAINELFTQHEALSSLTTTSKTSIIAAINELVNANAATNSTVSTLDARTAILTSSHVGTKNSIFRGKQLDFAAVAPKIADGSFDGICLGDYFYTHNIYDLNWRIVAFDPFYYRSFNGEGIKAQNGGSSIMTRHHVLCFPDWGGADKLIVKYFETNTPEDLRYTSSDYFNTYRPKIIELLLQDFGDDHLLFWPDSEPIYDDNGAVTGFAQFEGRAELIPYEWIFGERFLREDFSQVSLYWNDVPRYPIGPLPGFQKYLKHKDNNSTTNYDTLLRNIGKKFGGVCRTVVLNNEGFVSTYGGFADHIHGARPVICLG